MALTEPNALSQPDSRGGRRYALVFRGVRGSVSHPAPALLGYGAHTSCAEISLGPEARLILDAGTGLLAVSTDRTPAARAGSAPLDGEGSPALDADSRFAPEEPEPTPHAGIGEFHVLLTHYHRDHIEGLPFFDPLYDAGSRITFYGWPWESVGVQQVLEQGMRPPWFPVPLAETPSEKRYVDLEPGHFAVGDLSVRTTRLRHKNGVTAFRLEHPGGSLVFAADTEYGDPRFDEALIALAAGTRVLVHDAHFTPSELGQGRGMGHSTWSEAVEVARSAGVRKLILFHHHPLRADEAIDAIVRRARDEFSAVEAAREGDWVEF